MMQKLMIALCAQLFLLSPSQAVEVDRYLRIVCTTADNLAVDGKKDLLIIQQEDTSEYLATDLLTRKYEEADNIPFSFHFYEGAVDKDQELSREWVQEVYRYQKPSRVIEIPGQIRFRVVYRWDMKTDYGSTINAGGLHVNPLSTLLFQEHSAQERLLVSTVMDCDALRNRPYSVTLPVDPEKRFQFDGN